MADLLEVRNLQTYFYTSFGVVRAVDGVSFDVRAGETVALVGESGCGKTMSALSIMRLVPKPQGSIVGGEIIFEGRDLLTLKDEEMRRIRGAEIAMIFQEPMSSLNPVLTIGRQITETLEAHSAVSKEEARDRALELLRLVGIPDPVQSLSEY
ncbi:MAG: ABC transporter ATP-binding protein, partial [Candidatus Binatota bacterium]